MKSSRFLIVFSILVISGLLLSCNIIQTHTKAEFKQGVDDIILSETLPKGVTLYLHNRDTIGVRSYHYYVKLEDEYQIQLYYKPGEDLIDKNRYFFILQARSGATAGGYFVYVDKPYTNSDVPLFQFFDEEFWYKFFRGQLSSHTEPYEGENGGVIDASPYSFFAEKNMLYLYDDPDRQHVVLKLVFDTNYTDFRKEFPDAVIPKQTIAAFDNPQIQGMKNHLKRQFASLYAFNSNPKPDKKSGKITYQGPAPAQTSAAENTTAPDQIDMVFTGYNTMPFLIPDRKYFYTFTSRLNQQPPSIDYWDVRTQTQVKSIPPYLAPYLKQIYFSQTFNYVLVHFHDLGKTHLLHVTDELLNGTYTIEKETNEGITENSSENNSDENTETKELEGEAKLKAYCKQHSIFILNDEDIEWIRFIDKDEFMLFKNKQKFQKIRLEGLSGEALHKAAEANTFCDNITDGITPSTTVIAPNENIYTLSYNGVLYQISPSMGLKQHSDLGASINSTMLPSLAPTKKLNFENGNLYALTEKAFFTINPESLDILLKIDLPFQEDGYPYSFYMYKEQNLVFITYNASKVYYYSLETGALMGHFSVFNTELPVRAEQTFISNLLFDQTDDAQLIVAMEIGQQGANPITQLINITADKKITTIQASNRSFPGFIDETNHLYVYGENSFFSPYDEKNNTYLNAWNTSTGELKLEFKASEKNYSYFLYHPVFEEAIFIPANTPPFLIDYNSGEQIKVYENPDQE